MGIETVSDNELNAPERWEVESNRLDHGWKATRGPALVRVSGKAEAVRHLKHAINEALEVGHCLNIDLKDHGDMVVLQLTTTKGWRVFRAAKA